MGYAWVMRSAVGRMVIASLPPLTAMDATSTHTVWATKCFTVKDLSSRSTPSVFKVVTRFHAPAGELTAIEQFYIQDGKEIHHPNYSAGGNDNMESDAFCAAQKTSFGDRNSFSEKGGMKAMGEALDRGMVLVISMWDDIAVNMNWLDS